MFKSRRGGLRSSWAHNLVGYPAIAAVTIMPMAPAYADIVAATDPTTGAQITATTITPGTSSTFNTAGGSVTQTGTLVTTGTIRNGVGYNVFSEFNVSNGTNVHMVQPDGTSALVNVVDGAGPSQIDGQVTFIKNNTTAGSNVFMVNSDGFIVGASGVINAGQLTMSTPAASHVADLLLEAQGTTTGATADLFAGDEELNSSANIEVYGTINAERLELRAGARMVLDGTITVEDASGSGTVAPAVSTEGIQQATGVSVENGVIRLFAGGNVSVGSSARATAKRAGGAGGLIQGASGGTMTIAGGAQIDVAGSGSGSAGSVILYGENSAAMAAGSVIDASATAGSGGFASIQSSGNVTVAGEIAAGSDSSTKGAVVLKGDNVTVGNLTTAGGDLGVVADNSVTISGAISTRHVAVGGDALADVSTSASGDLLVFAPEIDVQSGAALRADGNNGQNGGLVGLIAYDRTTGVLWTFEGDDRAAEIDITNAEIRGGAVLINAYAEATNVFGDDADSLTEFSNEFESVQSRFESYLDTVADTVENVIARGPDLVNDLLIPLQVYDVSADAEITISGSTITGDGNWKNDGISPTAGYTGDIAENGINMQSGLALAQYDLFTGQPIEITGTLLPQDWNPSVDSVYIHSHAATEVEISPITIILAVGIAITDVDSQVKITDTDIASTAGDVALRSTASETNAINIASWPVAGLAGGLIISARDLDNQLLVDGGSINAAGNLDARALTGITQTFSNVADAYQDGWYAAAVTISVSSATTEAAIGGDIDTGSDVQLDAETLIFDRTSITNANMGLAPINTTAAWNHTLGAALEKFKNRTQSATQGDDASEEDKKPGSAGGFALDVQIEDTDTYASLGGDYRDWSNGGAVTALAATDVLAGGNVNVNSDMRFASVAEGGVGIYRSIISAMGSLDFMTKKHAAALKVSQEDLTGSYGKAKFVNIGVGWLEGDTIAEIGSDVTLSAVDLNVNALTSWPSITPFEGIKLGWEAFAQDVADFEVPAIASDGSTTTDEFEAPDILTYIDPYTYVTTETKAKAIAPVAKDVKSEQESAIAVSLNFFSTQNKTEAAVRSGADITLSGDLAIEALAEGLFVHVSNLPLKNPLGSAKTEDSVGGTAVVARTASDVIAVIEDGVSINATGDVNVEAVNDIVTITQTFASASAKGSSINAAVSASIIEAETTARVDDTAIITADEVTISADDTSILWSMAGSLSKGQEKGVGASGAVNFVTREISAGIGRSGEPLSSVDGTTTITANTLTIDAKNQGLEVAATIAGSFVHGKTDDEEASNDEATMTPNALLSFEEYFAISQQNRVETYPDETGERKETGWSIAGSASLNLVLANSVEAELETFGTVDLTGDLSVTATSTETAVAVAGSAATGKDDDPDAKTNALAGAFSVTVGMRDVSARISAADVDAAGVTLSALDSAMTVGVSAGGAKSSNADKTLAGSVVVNWLTGETRSEADDVEVEATGDVVVEATDDSVTAAGAGALSVNASKTQGYGIGVGVAANTLDRATTAQISGASDIVAASLSVLARTTAEIYGIGFAYGAGKTGAAGSVAVNTWTGGARALIDGTSADRITIDAGSLTVDAEETVAVWSLAGAVTRGQNTAVGGAFAVNTLVGQTEASADYVTLSNGLNAVGAVTIDADATSDIGVLAVAGAQASLETGVGIGVAVNTITAGTTAGLTNALLASGTSVDVTADSDRGILSLGGGVTQAGRGGAGFALTTNLIVASDTKVDLDGSDLTLTGDLTARAENDGTIGSLAVGISLSKDKSLGGGVTVNVLTGQTLVEMDGATVDAANVAIAADDGTVINSLSGAAAKSASGTGIGGAISANVIVHDTAVEIANSQITTGTAAAQGLTATATNTGEINTLAAALSQSSGGAAYSGSIAVGDIGNSAWVEMAGGTFTGGDLTLAATKTTEIDILSGSAAVGSGGSAFGAGVTVALIHGATTADLLTPGAITGGSLSVTATNDQDIDGIAVAGGFSGSAPAGSGSIVYSQIGTAPSGGPSVDPMNKNSGDEDTVAAGQAETEDARDDAFTTVSDLSGETISATLDQGDVTRARVELASEAPDFDDITIAADETSSIDSLAGVLAGSSSSAFGGSIAVNLVYGDTEAELILPATADLTVDGELAVTATQDGAITTMAAAGAAGSSSSGTGSIVVNVMNREALARVATASGLANLTTTGNNVAVTATQTGTIRSLAGAAAIGGSNGIGGSVAVTVQSDDVYAAIDGVSVEAQDASGNGTIDVDATSDLEVETYAVAAGIGGSGAFGGSVSVTVADGTTEALVRNAELAGADITVNADAMLDLAGTAGAVAASGSTAAGLGVVTNIAALNVGATLDTASAYAAGDFILQADAGTDLSGIAIGGALSGSVSVAGSAVANTSSNTVDVTLKGGSAAIARDSAMMTATATTDIGLGGGAEEHSLDLSFAGGGSLGLAASVAANLSENTAQAIVTDGSVIVGAGDGTVTDIYGDTRRGTIVDAMASTSVNMIGVTAGAGGSVGVAAGFGYTTADDTARVRIGEGTTTTAGIVGGGIGVTELARIDATSVNAAQDAYVRSRVDTDISTIGAAVGLGGSAAVGAASTIVNVTTDAETLADAASIGGMNDVVMDADNDTDVETIVVGAGGGGYVGAAASAGVTLIEANALTRASGGAILAQTGDLTMTASNTMDTSHVVGGLAGGLVGAAGAIGVTVAGGSAKVVIETADGAYDVAEDLEATSRLEAGGVMTVEADTNIKTDVTAVSGAGGAFALALSGNVTLVESVTQVNIDADQTLISNGNMSIAARETVDIDGIAGSFGAAAVGVGASLDYASFSGLTDVTIGGGTTVTSNAGTLDIAATSQRDIDSTVVVGTVAGVGFAAAVSVLEAGGTTDDSDRDEQLANVQTEVSGDNDGGGGSGSVDDLLVYSGGSDIQDGANSARQNVDVTAASTDAASVNIGNGAVLSSAGAMSIDVTGDTAGTQLAGALSVSLAGASSGTAVADISNDAILNIGNNVQLSSGGDLSLTTSTGNGTGDTIYSQAATVAGSLSYAAGVGVAVANSDSQSQIVIGSNLDADAASGNLTMEAQRTDIVKADVFNVSIGATLGAGVAVATATNEGDVGVTMAGGANAELVAQDIDISAEDTSAAVATATGSSGGILAGLNGVVVSASNTAGVATTIGQTEMRALTIDINAMASSRASARATGIAAGLAGVGASVATATTDVTVATTITDIDATADEITIAARYDDSNGDNAYARATSSSGGAIAGNGADATARLDYDVTTDLSGDVDATEAIAVTATADDASAYAEGNGKVGGIAAAGAVLATAEHMNTSTVETIVRSGSLSSDDQLTLSASNAPSLEAVTDSGSGGVISGSYSLAKVDGDTETQVDLGAGGNLLLSAMDVRIGASSDATLASELDNLSAAAVGFSGARSETDFDTDVDTLIRGTVDILGYDVALTAANNVTRPRDGFNITSGSGGLLDVAAVQSFVTVNADTDLAINGGASVTGIGDPEAPGDALFAVTTDMDLTDRVSLDAGGAIAVPVGESTVKVASNTADLTIGNVDIFTVGDLEIVAGGDTNLKAESNAKSYGLAGAATANTEATYYGDHVITIGSGAVLESLGDIAIKAGHTTTGIQNVVVDAESRVFNKTAIPIPTDPAADALADTTSSVNIQSGAQILAVTDVYLYAEGGGRDVSGYGRGKDLYREVAAAIANALGSLVGADDVSLEFESGSSTDRADNGIAVNGSVRAGSRNEQILRLNTSYGIANATGENYDGMNWTVEYNQSLASELQDRIDVLNGYINNATLSQNQAALDAWRAERSLLISRQAAAGSTLVDVITVDPVYVSEGNITLRADYVDGGASGLLNAPGDAEITIESSGEALLRIAGAFISEDEGGKITLNDVRVRSAADIAAQNEGGGSVTFGFVDGESSSDPVISIKALGRNTSNVAQPGMGSISIVGDIANPRGLVQIETAMGDLDISGDISGKSLDLKATNGNLVLGYIPGFREVGGTPEDQYASYFSLVEDQWRNSVRLGLPASMTARNGQRGFSIKSSSTGLTAGRNIFISADTVNINGPITAGRSYYQSEIGANVAAEIAALGAGTGTQVIYDPAGSSAGSYQSSNISGDVRVSYNFDTGRLELDPVVVEGGTVEIFGDIISTGPGSIQALDGFGEIDITSYTTVPLTVNRLSLGSGDGVQGLVRITDTGQLDGSGNALVTEFRREGGQTVVYNSLTSVTEIDPDTGLSITRPSNPVSSSSGRTATYDVRDDRDYVVLQAEEVVRAWYEKEEIEVIIGISGTRERSSTSTTDISQNSIDLGFGPYVADDGILSDNGNDYAFSGTRLSSTTVTTQGRRKTHDSVKWYKLGSGWQHFRTDYETTTVHLYEHRVRADYDVNVSFAGSDNGVLNIEAAGDVYFADTVEATFGTATITSTGGSLYTAGKQVELSTATLGLSAVNGSITGVDGAFRVDQVDGATLTATARDAVNIREMGGDMNVVSVTATGRSTTGASTGNVTLYAQDTITQVAGGAGISGMNIDLTSEEGGLGSSTQNFIINTDGGTLTAQARGDIFIQEASGDLGINTVTSDFGSVSLTSPGRIVDRNDIETTDVRKQSELEDLWFNELQLSNTTTREAEQIAALEAERTHAYLLYWQERDAAGGATLTYTMDATIEASLRAAGWTDDMLAAYVAEREALYADWNAEAAYDPNYTYTATAAEQADVIDGIGWTASELTRSIRAGLVRQTGDTVIRVEDPNVTAFGNITLNAATGIGELTDTYVIAAGTNLSDTDLERLAAAEKDDISVTADGSIEVRQLEDLDFAFTDTTNSVANGTLTMITASNEIFSGAETAATLDTIQGTGDVQLRIDGEMRDAMTGAWAIQGSAIVLEAGDFASIGTEAQPVRLDILSGGGITARAGVDVNLLAIGGMPIDQVFAGETARLTSVGAMTDNVASGLPRVVADNIELSGSTIGTAAVPLVVTQNAANGSIALTTTTGDLNVQTSGDATFTGVTSALGGSLTVAGDMALSGNNVVSFATGETLEITIAGTLDTSAAGGTMAQGGTLDLTTAGGLGSATQDFVTALEGLTFTTTGTGATPVYVTNTGNLVLDIDRSDDAGSVVDVTVVGTLEATVNGTADIALTATEITAATLTGDVVTLVGTNGIGTTTPVSLGANHLEATASNGGIAVALTGDTAIDGLTAGAGAIAITGAASAVDIAAAVIATGDISISVASLTGSAAVTSTGGAIALTTSGAMALAAGSDLTTTGGNISLAAGGALNWASSTGDTNGGDLSLIGGAVTLATLDLTTDGGDASITAGNGLSATAVDLATVGGNVTIGVTGNALWSGGSVNAAAGTMDLDVSGDAQFASTAFDTNGTMITLDVDGALDAANTTFGTNGGDVAMTLGSGQFNTVSIATAGGTLDITTGGLLDGDDVTFNAGTGEMTLALGSGQFADATLTTDGSAMAIGTTGALSFAATSLLTTSGGDLSLTSGGAMSLGGTTALTSGGSFALNAGTVTTNGFSLDTEDGSITVTSGDADLTNTDLDAGNNTATVTVTGTLTTDTLTVTTDAADIAISATGAADLAGTDIASGGGNVALSFGAAADIDGSSVVTAGGTLDVASTGAFAFNASTFASQTGALTIIGDAGGAITGGSQVTTTTGALSVTVAGALTTTGSSLATNGGPIDLALGSLDATGGTIASAGGNVMLETVGNASLNGTAITTGGGAFDGTVGGQLAMTSASLGTATGDVTLDVAGNAAFSLATITTGGGAFDGTFDVDLTMANSSFTTDGGTFNGRVSGDMTMDAASTIASGVGTFTLGITGDAQLAGLSTDNATDDALRLTVDGTLSAANPATMVLTANADGALTTIRANAMSDTGPNGFRTQVARLDAEVTTGDVHINEADALRLERLVAVDGSVDIFTGGPTVVGEVRAEGANATATLSSMGDLLADSATITGDAINIFAFGGRMVGETGTHFTADTEGGAPLRLYANGDLFYAETAGDVILDFALSENGSLDLDLPGNVNVGVLGTPADLTIVADGDISIQRIGEATVDLADEVALSLISPTLYGPRTAQSPRTMTLEALPDGSSLYLGYGGVQDIATLRADDVDAKLYDVTPDDGVAMVLTDGAGGLADVVDVDFIGDGGVTSATDPWADPRPALVNRTWATGVVTLAEARIASGEVTTAGPLLTGQTVQVGGDVWFRQRTFDMLANDTFLGLDTDADAQIYAVNNAGTFGFIMLDEFAIQITDALVVNRKQGGVSLDGGQGFGLAVAVETGILSGDIFLNDRMGTTDDANEEEEEWLIEEDETDDTVRIPLIVADAIAAQ